MTRPRSSGTATSLLRSVLAEAGPGSVLLRADEREWASATFSGARHSIALDIVVAAEGPPARLLALPEHDFALRGEIVADCTVAFGQRRTERNGVVRQECLIELLTITAD